MARVALKILNLHRPGKIRRRAKKIRRRAIELALELDVVELLEIAAEPEKAVARRLKLESFDRLSDRKYYINSDSGRQLYMLVRLYDLDPALLLS